MEGGGGTSQFGVGKPGNKLWITWQRFNGSLVKGFFMIMECINTNSWILIYGSYHDITWVSKITFFKSSGDRFFDPKSLSIDLLVMVPDFFEITFDRFFSTSGNGPKRPEMVRKGQNKKI